MRAGCLIEASCGRTGDGSGDAQLPGPGGAATGALVALRGITNLEIARIMSHTRQVERRGGDRSHWTIGGPGGVPIEFDAVVTRRVPGEVLAWKSAEGEPVRHAGIVRFEPRGADRTRITVRMTYNPPAGLLSHAVASLMGGDPKQALVDVLVRFKSLLEAGRTRADGQEAPLLELRPESAASEPG